MVFEPETCCWSVVPPLPYSKGLPEFCEIVAAGSNFVVTGGRDPENKEPLDSLFVFDFLSSKWCCGDSMPDGHRSFFAYAADGDRTIFIAGGHGVNMNTNKSAWAYDVAKGHWAQLPDMTEWCPLPRPILSWQVPRHRQVYLLRES